MTFVPFDSPPPSSAIGSSAEIEICISCLAGNPPGIHFCQHCQTPLTSYAATGPLERAFALGNLVSKGMRHPKSHIRFAFLGLVVLIVVLLMVGMQLP